MSRAALLPTMGDPFILTYWMNFYRRVWQSEVDKLYVYMNYRLATPQSVRDYCESLLDGCEYTAAPVCIDHGPAVKHLLLECQEDLVMLIEEDGLVFRPGIIDESFRKIESNLTDIVGSLRGSCSPKITELSRARWNLRDPQFKSRTNWWPNFFFISRENLLRTDLDFAAKTWQVGERVESLDVNAPEFLVGDTFVHASMQLRNMRLREFNQEQFHSFPHDPELKRTGSHLWSAECRWLHIGSLSMTTQDMPEDSLLSDPALYRTRTFASFGPYETEPSLQTELVRRFAWLKLIFEQTKDEVSKVLPDICANYAENMRYSINTLITAPTNVDRLFNMYKGLMPF